MTKAVIYSRVSSGGNRQDTERQTNELIEYANKMGFEPICQYQCFQYFRISILPRVTYRVITFL
jgi:DNA invertase Pin-like site-specific DNA recombinase